MTGWYFGHVQFGYCQNVLEAVLLHLSAQNWAIRYVLSDLIIYLSHLTNECLLIS